MIKHAALFAFVSKQLIFFLRSCRQTLLATTKVRSTIAATSLQTTRWSRLQKKGACLCTKGSLSGNLTWGPPSFSCSRLPETSASACSPGSESEWGRASAASVWLNTNGRCGLNNDGKVEVLKWLQTRRAEHCGGYRRRTCHGLQLPGCFVPKVALSEYGNVSLTHSHNGQTFF